MRIKADLYSSRLFEYWELKKRDQQTLPVISHRNMKINTRDRRSMRDNSPFVFAGLWEGWKDPANDEWLHNCTIITGGPHEGVAGQSPSEFTEK
jgi:putative SOS response-associated peptidase YedK